MIPIRNKHELRFLRKSGQITAAALKKVIKGVKPGVNALELNEIADKEIKKLGGGLAFTTVPGYHWATCININEAVVHGIPGKVKVRDGDIVSIDLGASYNGWCSDASWSILVGEDKNGAKKRFLRAGEEAVWAGINQAKHGSKVGDISFAMQEQIEQSGYSVVRSLTGHGIGKKLHEDPEIPGFGKKNTGPELKTGMSLAIEIIYTAGSGEVILERDGWTISSADNSLSAMFEMSVVVGKEKAEILTNVSLD